uniref:Uncharacterized protein n=1 Tax=Schlesneria paludicola TaxID=360056 RepID=A0A7C4LKD1_9PLAN
MSTWRVVWPAEEDEPAIIPFPVGSRRPRTVPLSQSRGGAARSVAAADLEPECVAEDSPTQAAEPLTVIDRARLLFANRRCIACGSPLVLPLERDDAVRNRCGQPIPGTATLIGFQCGSCHAEWSV